MRHWLFSCKQISRLISDSMDRQLPLTTRMGIRFHLMMCALCRHYRKQLLYIKNILHNTPDPQDLSCQALSEHARQRIEQRLKEKQENRTKGQ
jgi:hypothetical protein